MALNLEILLAPHPTKLRPPKRNLTQKDLKMDSVRQDSDAQWQLRWVIFRTMMAVTTTSIPCHCVFNRFVPAIPLSTVTIKFTPFSTNC